MDRELPAEAIRKTRIRRYSRVSAMVVIVLVCFFAIRAFITPSVARDSLITAVAEVGPVEETVMALGTVVPDKEQVITSPIQSKIERVLVSSGEPATSGQSLLKLDKQSIQMKLKNCRDELELLANKREQLNSRLNRAEIDLQAEYDIKELQTQFIESQFKRVQHLHEIGGATGERLKQAELNQEIARRELAQLASQMDNQQTSLKADIKEVNLQIRIQNNKLTDIARQLDLADAKASFEGVVTWINDNIGASVSPGDEIARVSNLSTFRIEATISEINAAKLKVGGTVRVRINDLALNGTISNIMPTVQNGIVTFLVALEEPGNASLRANLKVDVFVVTACRDNAVRVRKGAFLNGKVDQKVFVIDGARAQRHIVNIGASNYDFVEILGDIRPGEEVIISDMKSFHHMEEVTISSD